MKSFKQHILDEGINDPAIFKAVFMAGGPGSGKSFMAGKTALTALGLKIINSDDVFERAMKKAELEPTPKNIYSPKGQALRAGAKGLTAKKQALLLQGRIGLAIDGTGKDYAKIKRQRACLTGLGYDTLMILVNTDEETAQRRNLERRRKMPATVVSKMWSEVQNNIGKFQNLFGTNFIIVDNSEGANADAVTLSAYRKVSAWTKQPPENHLAKKWIQSQKELRGITR